MGHALTFFAGGLWITLMMVGSFLMMISYGHLGNTYGATTAAMWFISVVAIFGIYLQWLGV